LVRGSPNPEHILGEYDLVFAKAKCAMEALAVGCAVILCDFTGLGPMVTYEEFDRLRRLNFGMRTLTNEITVAALRREIGRYNSADAAKTSARVRVEIALEPALDELINLYGEAIAEWENLPRATPQAQLQVMQDYLAMVGPNIKLTQYIAVRVPLRPQDVAKLVPIIGRPLAAAAHRAKTAMRTAFRGRQSNNRDHH
jgi:hypothetical protein